MADKIADDFNRANGDIDGTVATGPFGGFTWQRFIINSGSASMDISANRLIHDGGETGWAGELALEPIDSPFIGAQITVLDEANARDVMLAIKVENSNNFWYGEWSEGEDVVRVAERFNGTVTTLDSQPSPPITKPFTFSVTWNGGDVVAWVNDTPVADGASSHVETILWNPRAAILTGNTGTDKNQRLDDFNASFPWNLGLPIAAPDASTDYNSLVAQFNANRLRLDSLLGGRNNTVLTSPFGLDDAVPTAKIHLIGRC